MRRPCPSQRKKKEIEESEKSSNGEEQNAASFEPECVAENLCEDVCELLSLICSRFSDARLVTPPATDDDESENEDAEESDDDQFRERRRIYKSVPPAMNRMIDIVSVWLHTRVAQRRLAQVAMGLASLDLPILCLIGNFF